MVALAVVLVITRAVPAHGFGVLLRLAVAALLVLLLPGALVQRAVGTPPVPGGVAVGGALVWSLVAIFAAQTITFVVRGSIVTTIGVLLAISTAATLFAFRHRDNPRGRGTLRPDPTLLLSMGVGLAVGAFFLWSPPPVIHDAVEHLSRTRKLAELPAFSGVGASELFRDAKLHPGYAFPLWHTALAAVARIGGLDPQVVIQLGVVILAPLALVIVHGATVSLTKSRSAGLAAALVQAAWAGPNGYRSGLFSIITGPGNATLLLLIPAVIGLQAAFLEQRSQRLLLAIGAASLSVAVVHPTYLLFALALLGGFAVARWVFSDSERAEGIRGLVATGVAALSPVPFLLWLAPKIAATSRSTPDAEERLSQLGIFRHQLDMYGQWYAIDPAAISRTGPLCVAALLGVVVALVAHRHRWGAFALGATGALLALALLPPLTTVIGEVASIGQARRVVNFIPVALVVAGALTAVANYRLPAVLGCGVLGILLIRAYPGDLTYSMARGGGPEWVSWLAAGTVLAAFLAAPWLRRSPRPMVPLMSGGWVVACAVALTLPVFAAAVTFTTGLRGQQTSQTTLPRSLVHQLRYTVRAGDVVFSTDEIAYTAASVAPIYVNTAKFGHVWDRWKQRHKDANTVLSARPNLTRERIAILTKYDVDWVLVPPNRARAVTQLRHHATLVYSDKGYALFRWR